MNLGSVDSKCPCGDKLTFPLSRPSFLGRGVSKATCSKCKSRFMVVYWRERGTKDLAMEFKILNLSPKAKRAAKKAILDSEAS